MQDMINSLVSELKTQLGDNLVFIISIGSFGKEEFSDKLSDLDFIIVLDKVDYLSLTVLKSIQQKFALILHRKLDLKPHALIEFRNSFNSVYTGRFTDGWGAQMILNKNHPILYSKPDIDISAFFKLRPISSGALHGIDRNLEKIRKLLVSEIHVSHGEIYQTTAADISKMMVSCASTILRLALAYKEIFVSSIQDAIKKGPLELPGIDFNSLQDALDLKIKGFPLSESQIINLYNLCCKIQFKVFTYHEQLQKQKPIIIIGGTSGTGKTSCANELCRHGFIDHRIGTGFVREAIRAIIPKEVNSGIHEYTFRPSTDLLYSFTSQSAVLKDSLRLILSRAKKEGTSLVLEGTHLIPGEIPTDIVDLFVILAVSDKSELARIMNGDTHKFRKVSSADIDNSWCIQEYLIAQAKKFGIPVIYSDKENAVSYILRHFKVNFDNQSVIETNAISENKK